MPSNTSSHSTSYSLYSWNTFTPLSSWPHSIREISWSVEKTSQIQENPYQREFGKLLKKSVTRFLRNVGNVVTDHTASHHWRQYLYSYRRENLKYRGITVIPIVQKTSYNTELNVLRIGQEIITATRRWIRFPSKSSERRHVPPKRLLTFIGVRDVNPRRQNSSQPTLRKLQIL
jgi:hypothetical protein